MHFQKPATIFNLSEVTFHTEIYVVGRLSAQMPNLANIISNYTTELFPFQDFQCEGLTLNFDPDKQA